MLIWIILQILIESLPISSSGHVQLAHRIYNYFNVSWYSQDPQLIDFLLHIPALAIMLVYFFTTWWYMITGRLFSFRQLFDLSLYRSLVRPLIFLVVVDGITFAWWMSGVAAGALLCPWSLTIGFMLTAFALYVTRYQGGDKKFDWNLYSGIILGFVQGFALMPGVSRFATTFCAGKLLGYKARDAFAVSFLIQCPLVIAACGKAVYQGMHQSIFMEQFFNFWMMIGIVFMSCISYGLLCFMGYLIERNWLWYISWYMLLPIVITLCL